MNDSEQDFIERINKKEEQAFCDLFTRFRDYLVLFAMRRVEQLGVAEDIVQETFIAVLNTKKVFNSYKGFKAYLYDLVQNKCLNYLRDKAVENKYLSYVQDHYKEDENDYNLIQEEVYRQLYMAMRELPEKCRAVFELYIEGKKNNEIAEQLGITILTVKSHKQHALRYLKERMGKLFFLFMLMRDY